MSYVDGFVAAVPAANREAYRRHATEAAPLFKEFGAIRMVENWGDDVPDGQVTDFRRAVKAEPGEVVVFSWVEYPDRQARDAANAKIMTDPRMMQMGDKMPFDGRRMIFGGFAPLVDDGVQGRTGYVDGALLPVPVHAEGDYRELARRHAAVIREHGALRVVDAWGDDIPDGKTTDYRSAVKAGSDEGVVFSWIEWPSKEARDDGWRKVMADQRMHAGTMPFDGQRMILGGFVPILDVSAGRRA